MWNRGSAVRNVSFAGVPFIQAAKARVFERRLVWVSMAALGVPVVPPVYCRAAMSFCGLICRLGGFCGASFSIW